MASTLKHLRSSTADKRPTASGLVDGQLAINTASGTPAVFFKDSNGGVVKVGPAHVGASAPNAVPAGSAGNSLGELWVDNSLTTPGLNYYTGSAFVNLTPSGTTTTVGLVELATPAETQTGTDAVRAVTPSGLQSKVSDSTSTTSSTTIASSTAVKSAYDLANAALPKAGGTVTGELLIGNTGSLVFEGSTDDSFETTIAVTDPTADRTITFPNVTGTVVTTGDSGTVTSTMIANDTIVNTDINSAAAIAYSKLALSSGIVNTDVSASAAIAYSKLATLTAGNIVLGNASNVATSTAVTGDVTINNAGVTAIAAGAIVDADVSASAEIAVSKLADGTARQLLQTDAAGTGVEWASNIDIPGTLDVTSAATFDSSVAVTGALTKSGNNVVTVGDTGTVTSTMIADGTIVNADVNASAAIAGTKISPDFGSQNVTTTGTVTGASLSPTSSSVPTNGVYLPAANSVAVATNGTGRLFVNSSGSVGVGTSSPSTLLHVSGPTGTTFTLDGANDYSSTAAILMNQGRSEIRTTIAASGGNPGGSLLFRTRNTSGSLVDAVTIDSSQRVGIGTTSPGAPLDVVGSSNTVVLSSNATDATTKEAKIQCRHYTNAEENVMLLYGYSTSTVNELYIGGGSSNQNALTSIVFSTSANNTTTSGTERARIDSSGRLLVGTSSAQGVSKFQIQGTTSDSTEWGGLFIRRGLAAASISAGFYLGQIDFGNQDGGVGALIRSEADAQWGTNDYPGRLVFSTTADGASSPTERMRIANNGSIFFGKTVEDFTTEGVHIRQGNATTGFVTAGGTVITFSRTTNDGTIVSLRQDGIEEGTISVSGTTVSYNGAHLSRWSQLPSGDERTDILRGSVLSNLDEMCEWGEEDNEQLNRMKVSDVEGDKNVSGVFQCWDDDDDTYTNDFYCAMTGDFIIRIAEGVTVERGDLLMSAGDGTAKPQDDDIIRSKTIAKVTSTTVSCTYADGSYCVPCVLMAC